MARMALNTTLPQGIEIFREGTHVDDAGVVRTYTRADIDRSAAVYDPALHDAPLTLGHPKTDEPRYGAVDRLQAVDGPDGKRRLVMSGRDVEPAFAEAVLARRFPKRSTAFYSPEHPGNPVPGSWYVRHVGFLGAQPPAVRGLADLPRLAAAFADAGDGLVCFSETTTPTPNTPTDEDARVSKELQDQLAAEKSAREKAEADRQAAEARATQAQDQLNANLAGQRAARHAEHVAFAEAQLGAGRLSKPEAAECVALLDLVADAQAVQFGEGDDKKTLAPAAVIRRLLERLPPLVAFAERGGHDAAPAAGAARGKSDAEIDQAAKAYAAQHKVSYAQALGAVVSFTA